jgi:hypothetical protein
MENLESMTGGEKCGMTKLIFTNQTKLTCSKKKINSEIQTSMLISFGNYFTPQQQSYLSWNSQATLGVAVT